MTTVRQLIALLQNVPNLDAAVGLEAMSSLPYVGPLTVDKLLITNDAVTLHTQRISLDDLARVARGLAKQGMLAQVIVP